MRGEGQKLLDLEADKIALGDSLVEAIKRSAKNAERAEKAEARIAELETDRFNLLETMKYMVHKSALEWAEADCAAKGYMLTLIAEAAESGHANPERVAKLARRALAEDRPGGKLLDAETATALPDDNWLVRQLESCRAEVATWPEYKRRAMLAALDGGTQ